jgi:HSP20 family protein
MIIFKYKKKGGFVMGTQTLARRTEMIPTVFDEFFKPLNDWFEGGSLMGRTLQVPSVNITEHKNEFLVSMAVPGMKKEDFHIDVDGNMLTISSEKEENKEEKEWKFTRKEYNYTSFSRSFTLPDEIQKEKIEAKYEDGLLKIQLPRKEGVNKLTAKHIPVK